MSEEWIEDLLDPNYECGACAIEGQPCDVPAAVLAERERIIKVLEDYAQKELERLRAPSTYLVSEENYAYYEGILEAVSVIKGEQK